MTKIETKSGVTVAVATVLAAAMASSGLAFAQDSREDSARAQTGEGGGLEEITVTARKFEERLIDAPLAVTAFTGEAIERAGVRDVVDLARLTPGFAMQDASRVNDQPFIRGMSVNSFFRDQQHASSFIDGIFVQGLARMIDFETEVERVEVIRGPQSALYGRATFSGAINYITRLPTNELEGKLVAALGENGLQDVSGTISGPIVADRLQYRLSLQSHEYDGQWTNALDGIDVGGEDTKGGALMLRFLPTDALQIVFRGSHVEFDDAHSPTVIVPSTVNNCSLGGARPYLCGEIPVPEVVSLNLTTLPGGKNGGRASEQDRYYVRADWELGPVTLRSATGYNEERFDYAIDGDGTPLRSSGGLFESRFIEDFRDRSQDLRIESNAEGRFRWLAGLYYYDGDYEIWRAAPAPTAPNLSNSLNRSVYGSVTFGFTDALELSVDGRYQRETVQVINPAGARINSQTTTNFLPRAILDFKPGEGQTYYLSASKGSRPAAFNTFAGTPPDLINIKEQEIWSYELGGRWALLGDRATLGATLFFIDWDNQTTQRQVIGTTGTLVTINANVGQTEIQGIEFEAAFAPTERLDLRATYAYVDAEYKDFLSDVCFLITSVRQCAGQKLQNTPRSTASLLAGYQLPITENWDWVARGDLSYRSDMPVAEINTARNPSLTLLNLRTGIERENLAVMLFVNNVTDEDTPAFATRFLDLNTTPNQYAYQLTLRRAREFGLSASYRF